MADKIEIIKDERGCLMPFGVSIIPFEIKRVFFIDKVPVGQIRGKHAHHENLQFLICLNGKIRVTSLNGYKKKVYILKKGDTLLLDKLTWSTQEYMMRNSELMVLCSHEYDKDDYIKVYSTFKKLSK